VGCFNSPLPTFEIVFVGACYGVLISPSHPQLVLSSGTGTDLLHEQAIYQHRAVNANETIGLEFVRSQRDRFSEQLGALRVSFSALSARPIRIAVFPANFSGRFFGWHSDNLLANNFQQLSGEYLK
jgi:hypothetical protein